MPVSVSVRGIEELRALFKRVPVEIRRIAVEVASSYLLGDREDGSRTVHPAHGLKHYPPPFVGHKRTYKLEDHWRYKKTGGGYGSVLYNNVVSKYGKEYAKWVQGDGTQARHVRARGWRTVSEVISTNIKGAIRAINRAVEKWIKANNK